MASLSRHLFKRTENLAQYVLKRNLNLHEHVSMGLLRDSGAQVPNFGVAKSVEEAKRIISSLSIKDYVIKAQVLTGGRGRGKFDNGFEGGVKLVSDAKEACEVAGKMLGHKLVTKQTGSKGVICNEVLIAERLNPKREFYFAIMMDPAHCGIVLLASSVGGVNIEEIAAENPDAIITEPIDVSKGVTRQQAEAVASKLGFSSASISDACSMIERMYATFIKSDALMLEINPFVEDKSGKVICLDAKIKIDDNAEFRQKRLFETQDWSQADPREREANKFNLNYIALDGDIGCLVNGAGLAMATMDLIKLHGGNPANFLDVGGGATAEQVTAAFKIISSDPKVKTIFVNIFGGIMRCDIIAQGIIKAVETLSINTPIVVRLQGNCVDDAKALIHASNMKIQIHDDLEDAATLACKIVQTIERPKKTNDVNFELPI